MVANVQDKFWVHTYKRDISCFMQDTEHSSRFTWELLCVYIFFVFIAANWLHMRNRIFARICSNILFMSSEWIQTVKHFCWAIKIVKFIHNLWSNTRANSVQILIEGYWSFEPTIDKLCCIQRYVILQNTKSSSDRWQFGIINET